MEQSEEGWAKDPKPGSGKSKLAVQPESFAIVLSLLHISYVTSPS